MGPHAEPPSPARLFAALAGVLLFALGVVGFFYSSSFGAPGEVEPALGALRTNAWLNLLYAALGALGLLLAGVAARAYCLGAGALMVALGVWGLALDPGAAILGFLPAAGADEALALTVGGLGLLAAFATPSRRPKRRRRPRRRREEPDAAKKAGKKAGKKRLEPRAKAARQRA